MIINSVFSKGKQLQTIINEIVKELESSRQEWFNECLRTLQALPDTLFLKNTRLKGTGEIIIKTYQIYLIMLFIRQHNYLGSQKIKQLYGSVFNLTCADNKNACKSYYDLLTKEKDDSQFRVKMITEHLTDYITSEASHLKVSLVIEQTLPRFIDLTEMVVADAFNDKATTAKIIELFKKNLSRNFPFLERRLR